MDSIDSQALIDGLRAISNPPSKKKILLEFSLYCGTCGKFWSQDEYGPKQWQCKCGSLRVRVTRIEKVYGI